MKKVYWSYSIGEDPTTDPLPEDYVESPKKFKSGYDTRYDHSKCPAWKEWGKNTWIISQPFDIGIHYNSKDKYLQTNLNQNAFDEYFHLADTWLNGEYPEIQMKYNLSLWTRDKDVWIEQVPHPLLSRHGIDLVPGTFPISVWFRPLVVGVKILDFDQNLWLPKGTPLYYIRFCSRRGDSTFSLEKGDPPKDLIKKHHQHTQLRFFTQFNAWDIIKKRTDEESKCPFSRLWKR